MYLCISFVCLKGYLLNYTILVDHVFLNRLIIYTLYGQIHVGGGGKTSITLLRSIFCLSKKEV